MANNIAELGKLSEPVSEHDMMGWVVIHGMQNKLMKFLATMAGHLSNSQLKIVNTREETVHFLQRVDGTLVDQIKD